MRLINTVFVATFATLGVLATTANPASAAAGCQAEYQDYVSSLQSADYYCGLEPNMHTDNLCSSWIRVVDFYEQRYVNCDIRDQQGSL